MTEAKTGGSNLAQQIGLAAGPVIALLIAVLVRPAELPVVAAYVLAIGVWMAIWWATEATHVAVTALLPIIIFPVAGITPIGDTLASYAHPVIYMFLGGFVIAIAIEKSGLHLRLALRVFQLSGVKARAIVAGFMVAAALISMWISNTSTTIMMLPIVMSVVYVVRNSMDECSAKELKNFELCMFLGVAYAATMGGVATLVGTPPNAFLAGFMESTYDTEIDFARWMIVGLPLTVVMVPLTWFILTWILFPVKFDASDRMLSHIAARRRELGKISPAEVRVGLVFLALVIGWTLRKPIGSLTGLEGLSDTAVAIAAAFIAFLVPSGVKGETLVVWEDTNKLPWGVLILFGGGLALATGMSQSGLTAWLGQQLAPLSSVHIAVLVVVACAMVIFLTELTSNVATTATFLPVMGAMAVETGNDPMILLAPITLAASFAFMLPVATPPNAIVFSSGKVSIPNMMRAGMVLNLLGVAVLTLLGVFVVPLVFG